MHEALNNQIKNEMFSAYLYYSMSLHFTSMNFRGFATWMERQAMEEMEHAKKFIDYVTDRGGKVTLQSIDKPQEEWSSPLAAFEDSLKHEKFITAEINKLVDLAHAENDQATHYMLGWFVTEQVEEEASVGEVVDMLKMVGDHKQAIFMLDSKLGQRQ